MTSIEKMDVTGAIKKGVFKVQASVPGVKLKVAIDYTEEGLDNADMAMQMFPSAVAQVLTELLKGAEQAQEAQDG